MTRFATIHLPNQRKRPAHRKRRRPGKMERQHIHRSKDEQYQVRVVDNTHPEHDDMLDD